MSDPIKEDDVKFKELLVKQHPTFDSFAKTLPQPEDVIEQDDNKMDDLLLLQSIASDDEVKYNSIEEKYEEEIMIDDLNRQIDEDIKRAEESGELMWQPGDEILDIIEIDFDDEF